MARPGERRSSTASLGLRMSVPRLLEIPVYVEEKVRAAGRHVALDGKRAADPELYNRVVGSDDARAEVDPARQGRDLTRGIDAQVADVRRQEDGQVDRDSLGRERNLAEIRDRERPDRVRRERRTPGGPDGIPRVRQSARRHREEAGARRWAG